MAFNPNHLQTLTESGIDPLVAEHYGIRSINAPEELPEGCESFHKHIPGLLFPLPDINGDKLYQIRADTPPPGVDGKAGGKYTTPDGAPTQLILWPAAKAILDSQNYSKVLIVEGTKQSLAATGYAPKGVLVVGITGCWGWKTSTSDTGIVDGLDEIVDSRLTVVCFDADIKTNQKVNDAAHALDKTLRTCGATTVKWLMLPDGGKTGLDDYLGKVLTNVRAKQLSSLMAKGLTQVPRFMEPGEEALVNGQIMPDEDSLSFVRIRISKEAIKKEVVTNALVKVVKVRSIVSDIVSVPGIQPVDGLTLINTELVLEVRSKLFGSRAYEITVPRSELEDVASWFAKIPDPASISLKIPTSRKEATELVNAITEYKTEDREGETAYTRLGWVMHDGLPCYLYQGGAVTEKGNITTVRGLLPGRAAEVTFPDLEGNLKTEELRRAVRRSLAPLSIIHRPELWGVVFGGLVYVAAGFQPKGILYLFGQAGSGKTHLAQGVTGFLSPSFGPDEEVMATLEGTANAALATTPPFHNAMILYDDAHPVTGKIKQAAQADLLDALSRIGYSGGSASARRAHWSKDRGMVEMGASSREHPFIVITAEFQPLRESDARSFFERTFIIQVSSADTYKTIEEMDDVHIEGITERLRGSHVMERLSSSGDFNLAFSGFLAHVAEGMREVWESEEGQQYPDPITAWTESVEKHLIASFSRAFQGDSIRLSENTQSYLIGMSLWLTYAEAVGAITHEERVDMMDDFIDSLISLKDYYSNQIVDTHDFGFLQLLNSIKATVASGDAIIVGANEDNQYAKPYATVIGRYVEGRNGYALMAKPLAKALHTEESSVKQVLATAPGVSKFVFWLNGTTVRGYLVEGEVWEDTQAALKAGVKGE
jgi:hypothetical protein